MAATSSMQDRSGPLRGLGRRARGPLAAMACVAILLGGCNSGAVKGPDGGDHGGSGGGGANGGNRGNGGGNGGNGGGGNGGGGNGARRYGFGLPSGPTSGEPKGFIYYDIRTGQCDQAQQTLEGLRVDDEILRIGIAVCRGDLSTARSKLKTLDLPPFDSLNWYLCELYRASASVAYQRPRSAFGTCPSPYSESSSPSAPEGGESPGPANSTSPSDAPQSSSGTGG
jgi:hypothetical protein